jgi:hypothetical protein
MAHGLLEVRWFGYWRLQNATVENVMITFSDTVTVSVPFGNNNSHLAPDYNSYSGSSAPVPSVRHYVK